VEEEPVEEESKDEIEEIIEKAKAVEIEEHEEELDPWGEFKTLCKDLGYDYKEVIDKAAWYYVEESGAATVVDPITQTKELAEALSIVEDAMRKMSEPDSLKKLREWKNVLKEMAEFKAAVREFKEGKMTTAELISTVKALLAGMK